MTSTISYTGSDNMLPVMPNHPFPAGAPPIERQESGGINSVHPGAGYPADPAILSPTAQDAYERRLP